MRRIGAVQKDNKRIQTTLRLEGVFSDAKIYAVAVT